MRRMTAEDLIARADGGGILRFVVVMWCFGRGGCLVTEESILQHLGELGVVVGGGAEVPRFSRSLAMPGPKVAGVVL